MFEPDIFSIETIGGTRTVPIKLVKINISAIHQQIGISGETITSPSSDALMAVASPEAQKVLAELIQ